MNVVQVIFSVFTLVDDPFSTQPDLYRMSFKTCGLALREETKVAQKQIVSSLAEKLCKANDYSNQGAALLEIGVRLAALSSTNSLPTKLHDVPEEKVGLGPGGWHSAPLADLIALNVLGQVMRADPKKVRPTAELTEACVDLAENSKKISSLLKSYFKAISGPGEHRMRYAWECVLEIKKASEPIAKSASTISIDVVTKLVEELTEHKDEYQKSYNVMVNFLMLETGMDSVLALGQVYSKRIGAKPDLAGEDSLTAAAASLSGLLLSNAKAHLDHIGLCTPMVRDQLRQGVCPEDAEAWAETRADLEYLSQMCNIVRHF